MGDDLRHGRGGRDRFMRDQRTRERGASDRQHQCDPIRHGELEITLPNQSAERLVGESSVASQRQRGNSHTFVVYPEGKDADDAVAAIDVVRYEIDAVRSLPFPADDLFAAIRALYNARAEDPACQKKG